MESVDVTGSLMTRKSAAIKKMAHISRALPVIGWRQAGRTLFTCFLLFSFIFVLSSFVLFFCCESAKTSSFTWKDPNLIGAVSEIIMGENPVKLGNTVSDNIKLWGAQSPNSETR